MYNILGILPAERTHLKKMDFLISLSSSYNAYYLLNTLKQITLPLPKCSKTIPNIQHKSVILNVMTRYKYKNDMNCNI